MRKLALAVVAAATLAGGAAVAQPYGYDNGYRHDRYASDYGGYGSLEQRKLQLDRRIDQGLRSGQLTRREAWFLRNEFDSIARIEARYRMTGGLSPREVADLDNRFDRLSSHIRDARRDDERRYGYNEYRPY